MTYVALYLHVDTGFMICQGTSIDERQEYKNDKEFEFG